MATFRDVYSDYYDNGLRYELINEIAPKVWKVSRKSDRMDYLAQDVTDALFTGADSKPPQLTPYGQLFAPDGENLLEQVKKVLNHPNLVSLVDCFALQFSDSGKLGRDRWFTVWDYCDAGNLGNLLVPSQEGALLSEDDDGDIAMEDTPDGPLSEDVGGERRRKFLPESLCWHVLTAVLNALVWLHDGVRDVGLGEDTSWRKLDQDVDWQPMLHRNINPRNIFIGYPRRKEWYGPVKLGNYGRLHVSGHCQTRGDQHAPVGSKAIAPPPDQDFARLEELVAFDTNYGSVYPYQRNQPYTMVSEYRALGEIIQAMMVEPTGSKHIKRIQSRATSENLKGLDYTGRLKNFLVKMMEFDPWAAAAAAKQPTPAYVTSALYREALEGVRWFMRSDSNAEVDAFVTPYMAEVDDYVDRKVFHDEQLLNSFKNVKEILEQFTEKK
ncbi:hypothetical protein F4808DRAFT_414023 [Astrocystis sublimbata]|nr:hypothetical protein F4808DRAFT_414023 [Astrocystis sublimbata]